MTTAEPRQGFGFPDISKIQQELRDSFQELLGELRLIRGEIEGLRADIRGDDPGGTS